MDVSGFRPSTNVEDARGLFKGFVQYPLMDMMETLKKAYSDPFGSPFRDPYAETYAGAPMSKQAGYGDIEKLAPLDKAGLNALIGQLTGR